MLLAEKQFLGIEKQSTDFDQSTVAILPFPYEGGVSYGTGTAAAPQAIIDASCYLELYDEVQKSEPYRQGLATMKAPQVGSTPQKMFESVYKNTCELIRDSKFVVLIGGDHSISSGFFKSLQEKYPDLGAIQLDAHADLRESFEGSKLSHACVMARIREMTPHTLQIGIRSMSVEEADKIEKEKMDVWTMHDFRKGLFNIDAALAKLPEHIFLTVDVDAFDWSVVASTGTPEPGGFSWDEAMELLQKIFALKKIVGFDVVELSYSPQDRNSPFAVAKLIYKMLGFKHQYHSFD